MSEDTVTLDAEEITELAKELKVTWPTHIRWMTPEDETTRDADCKPGHICGGFLDWSNDREHSIKLRTGQTRAITAENLCHELAHAAQVERFGRAGFQAIYANDALKAQLESEAYSTGQGFRLGWTGYGIVQSDEYEKPPAHVLYACAVHEVCHAVVHLSLGHDVTRVVLDGPRDHPGTMSSYCEYEGSASISAHDDIACAIAGYIGEQLAHIPVIDTTPLEKRDDMIFAVDVLKRHGMDENDLNDISAETIALLRGKWPTVTRLTYQLLQRGSFTPRLGDNGTITILDDDESQTTTRNDTNE